MKNQRKKTLRELTLPDRFLFDEATEVQENMQTLPDIILEKDVSLKEPPQAEKEQRKSPKDHYIKLDVRAQDEDGATRLFIGKERGIEQGTDTKGIAVFKNCVSGGVSKKDARAIAEISDEPAKAALKEL